jgi:ATP-dependent protease ClpP protease subunit
MSKKITISGEIGWDVTSQALADQFRAAKGDDIDIDIASPGGDVFTGIEIYNLIRDYKRDNPDAQILMTLKGLGASMASYIMMAPADMVVAEDNAVFMIHNPWSFAVGDYRAMTETGEFLGGLASIMADAYVKKTGKKKAEIRTLMDDETWLFGSEIKDAGFVDDMVKTDAPKNKDGKSQALAAARLSFGNMANNAKTKTDAKAFREKAAAMMNVLPIVAEAKPAAVGNIKTEKGDEEMEIKTLADLKANASAVYDEALAEIGKNAIEKERGRCKSLRDLKVKAVKVGDAVALIDEAIADGRELSAIVAQVTDMVMAAADSAGAISANGVPADENDRPAIEPVTEKNFFL